MVTVALPVDLWVLTSAPGIPSAFFYVSLLVMVLLVASFKLIFAFMKGLCIPYWPVARAAEWVRIKARTEMGRKCPIQHIIDAARPLSNHIHIIAMTQLYARPGWPVISDQYPGTGPAGGIATALLHSPFETNLILSCDIPRIDTGTLQFILATTNQVSVYR